MAEYNIIANTNREKAKAEIIVSVFGEKATINAESGKEIIVGTSTFSLSLKPYEYGFKKIDNQIFISSGALIDFSKAAKLFFENQDKNKLVLSEKELFYDVNSDTIDTLDDLSDKMINDVLSTKNTSIKNAKGRIIYISEQSGSDENDGLSKKSPIKTIAKLNANGYLEDDTILFERGGLYRGVFRNIKNGLTVGSYGEGQKPIIIQSKQNYAKRGLWELVDKDNYIWKLLVPVLDPGIITFNTHLYETNYYGEVIGFRVIDEKEDSGYFEMLKGNDLTFYWGKKGITLETFNQKGEGNELFLKSVRDPNRDFSNIEIGEDIDILNYSNIENVTLDNVCMKLTGGHAVNGAHFVKNLTVTNCVFAYIGGSLLWQNTRYGNAIQIFGSCDGFFVKNNWAYEIFDTAVTFQYHSKDKELFFKNIDIGYNIFERAYWLIEYWISPDEKGLKTYSENIYIHDNFCRKGFNCFGTAMHGIHKDDFGRKVSWGAMYCSGSLGEKVNNVIVKNNIFDRSYVDYYDDLMTRVFNYYAGGETGKETKLIDNTVIQYSNQFFGRFSNEKGGAFYTCEKKQITEALSKIPNQKGFRICIIKK